MPVMLPQRLGSLRPLQAAPHRRQAAAASKVVSAAASTVLREDTATTRRIAPAQEARPINREEGEYRELSASNGNTYLLAPRFAAGSFGAVHRAIDMSAPERRLVAKTFFLGDKGGKFKSGDREFTRTTPQDVARELGVLETVKSPLRAEAKIESEEGEQKTLVAVMPHMDGDLSWPLRFKKRLNLSEADLRVMLRSSMAQAAEDLQRLHDLNHLHFDVRPENMYFDEKGQVCMGDLGLASAYKPGQELDCRRGTVEHMAPEVLCGRPVGPKAEVWSLLSSWMTAALGVHNLIAARALPQARAALDQAIEAKLDAEYPEYDAMFRGLLRQGLKKELRASATGPLQAHINRITSWRDRHGKSPIEQLDLSMGDGTADAAYNRTLIGAARFDAPMIELVLSRVWVADPAERISMTDLRDEIRALQPVDSQEERLARAKFRQLATSSLLGTHPNGSCVTVASAAEQFAALRLEAALRRAS